MGVQMTPRERAIKCAANYEERELAINEGPYDALIEDITTEIQAASNEQVERCRAHDRQAHVAAFHRKFGVPTPERPGWPSQERIDLRVKLIAEEFCEFLRDCGYRYSLTIAKDARTRWVVQEDTMHRQDDFTQYDYGEIPMNLPKAADALIDMEYVILGTHCEFGIDSNPLWAEVNAANMRKEGSKRGDGKILKGDGWQGPDIEGELRKQGWNAEREE